MTVADLTIFWGATSGGVRTYLTRKRAFLAARGHRHLLVVPGARKAVRDEPEGAVVTLRGWPVPGAPGYRAVVSLRGAEAALLAARPDVVEVGDPYVLPWAAYRARRRGGFAVVLFAHSDFVEAYVRPALGAPAAAAAWAYARAVYRRADLVLAPSAVAVRALVAQGITGVELMPLGVDVLRFRPDRRREETRRALGADGRPVCLYAGRLSPEKGIDTLLAALPRLAAGNAVLWVAGGGSLEGKVRQAARGYPVRQLGYLGDPERLADLYAAADVVLVPGAHETFGLAVLEAFAAGTPVVGAAAGALPDLVSDDTGRLVPAGDAEALATAALRLAAEGREARSAACRRLAERYAWDIVLERLLARYGRLVDGHRAARREPSRPREGRQR